MLCRQRQSILLGKTLAATGRLPVSRLTCELALALPAVLVLPSLALAPLALSVPLASSRAPVPVPLWYDI